MDETNIIITDITHTHTHPPNNLLILGYKESQNNKININNGKFLILN